MTEDLKKVKDLLKVRNCSDKTAINYISCINRFKMYFKDRELKDLEEDDILEYLKVNFINLGYSSASINVNRAAIKYYYLVNFKRELNNTLLPSTKVNSRFPLIFDDNDFLKIINSTDNIKHKLWFALGLGSGLRINEVVTLKMGDFSFNTGRIRVIGKGNKQRYVPFPELTHNLLLEYYEKYKNEIEKFGGYIFFSVRNDYNNKHISEDAINYAINKLKKKFNLDKSITFHTLRHSFATNYIRNGGDLWKLKKILGHSHINSTTIYVHMADDFKEIHSPLDTNL